MSQIACKLSTEPKTRVTNMRSEAVFICSRGTYMIFLPGEAENTTFEIGHWEQFDSFENIKYKIMFL